MKRKQNPTRTRAKPPEGSRRPGNGSQAPPAAPHLDEADDYPGGGSTSGTDHPRQDEDARRGR